MKYKIIIGNKDPKVGPSIICLEHKFEHPIEQFYIMGKTYTIDTIIEDHCFIIDGNTELFLYSFAGLLEERWKEAEIHIIKCPAAACLYAIHILNHRWIKAEKYIMKDPTWSVIYHRYFPGVPFILDRQH